MTLPQNQIASVNSSIPMSGPGTSEAPLQAFIRRLHESRNLHSGNDEPVRGSDPWQGIGL